MAWPRRLVPVFATIALLCFAPSGAVAAGDGATGGKSAAQRLIDAYVPRLMLREGDEICDTNGEQYEPTTVNTVLGNPDVRLTEADESGDETLVKRAPTAADIAGLGEGFHLNLPADPLGDTCDYAKDFAKLKREGKAPAITNAHIARQKGRPGLAAQYWFFWYFNQFNDLHEGDWEGMQVVFEASNPAQALREGPSEAGLFQHGGGEKADWSDGKVEKEGTHPVVYPAARLARDLLRRRGLCRERAQGLRRRLRRHQLAAAPPSRPPDSGADPPGAAQSLCLAHLRRPLGPVGEELQQRADRRADQDPLARADDLDGRNPLDQPAPTGRLGPGPHHHEVLLRRRRRRHLLSQPHPGLALCAYGRAGRRPAADRVHRLADPLAATRPRQPASQPRLRPAPARLRRPLLAPLAGLRPDRPDGDPDHRRLRPVDPVAHRRHRPAARRQGRALRPAQRPRRHHQWDRRPDLLSDHRCRRDRRRARSARQARRASSRPSAACGGASAASSARSCWRRWRCSGC